MPPPLAGMGEEGKQDDDNKDAKMGKRQICFATSIILVFCVTTFLMGATVSLIGMFTFSDFAGLVGMQTVLVDLIPDYFAIILLSAGLLILAISLVGCSVCCVGGRCRKRVLGLLYGFTLAITTLAACFFAFGFEYVRIVTYAADTGFVDNPEGNGPIYRGIMNGFNNAFESCDPVAYRTDDVAEACELKAAEGGASSDEAAALEHCADVEKDRVYFYCRQRDDPWELSYAGDLPGGRSCKSIR